MALTDTQRWRKQMMQTTCVLLIEDDELTSARLEMLIENSGFGGFSAPSAAVAREALGLLVFPIVIIDRMLGDADGIDLCKEIRTICAPNRIYAMLLSARDSPADIAAALAAGADDYLSKRAGDDQLLERLGLAIRQVKLHMK